MLTRVLILAFVILSIFPFTVSAQTPTTPSCVTHDNNIFHTLYNSVEDCHYDHEHGHSPFTPEVATTFPGFDLQALLGGVQVGHTNPSSPMENDHKHGGFKWQVDLAAPQGCNIGFDGGTIAVDAYAIQWHTFGKQSDEFETRNHSSAALLRQCKSDNPSDKGYIYTVQLQEYGQRVIPYQGFVLPYPDNFQPQYGSAFGPYFTSDCIGTGLTGCRSSLNFITSRKINALSIWTSKPKTSVPGEPRPETPRLFRLLFRVRDTYQVIDSSDLIHPFTWRFLCGDSSYNPTGCRYNNTTPTIHEIMGDIPAEWDNLEGFDTNPTVGRVTAEGYTNQFGVLDTNCTQAGGACHPVKLVDAFVGRYSSEISVVKVTNPTWVDTPDRDVWFCNGILCSETSVGAVPSGWVGENN